MRKLGRKTEEMFDELSMKKPSNPVGKLRRKTQVNEEPLKTLDGSRS